MTAPTPEQVDAVADTIAEAHDSGAYWSPQVSARAILTTTDPDAQTALAASLPTEVMLAALVERGTLTPDFRRRDDGMAGATIDMAGLARIISSPTTVERRLVTPWEVAP